MLTSLAIQNFQSHEHTVLDLVPGVNVIVGTSDSGKTACLRGLFWITTNRPRGTAFIRHGTKQVEVTLKVKNTTGEHEVRRYRDSKEDYYAIGGEQHTALQGAVPQIVTDTIGLSDINIARQFDNHFLIFETPGHVAAALNAVTHLEDADAASATLRRQGVSLAGEIKDLQGAAETLKERLVPYDILDGQLVAVDGLLEQATRLDALEARVAHLLNQIDRLVEIDGDLSKVPVPPSLDSIFSMVEATATKVEAAEQLYGRLNRLWHDIQQVMVEQSRLPVWSLPVECLVGVETMGEQMGTLQPRVIKLRVIMHDLREVEGLSDALHQHMMIAIQTRDTASAQLTECPTCGQPVAGEAHAHVLKELAGVSGDTS